MNIFPVTIFKCSELKCFTRNCTDCKFIQSVFHLHVYCIWLSKFREKIGLMQMKTLDFVIFLPFHCNFIICQFLSIIKWNVWNGKNDQAISLRKECWRQQGNVLKVCVMFWNVTHTNTHKHTPMRQKVRARNIHSQQTYKIDGQRP